MAPTFSPALRGHPSHALRHVFMSPPFLPNPPAPLCPRMSLLVLSGPNIRPMTPAPLQLSWPLQGPPNSPLSSYIPPPPFGISAPPIPLVSSTSCLSLATQIPKPSPVLLHSSPSPCLTSQTLSCFSPGPEPHQLPPISRVPLGLLLWSSLVGDSLSSSLCGARCIFIYFPLFPTS